MSTFVDRVSTLDKGYVTPTSFAELGHDLSLYPAAKDDQWQLYRVSNNAQTFTTQSASYNSAYFIVNDTSAFPDKGLIMVGTEQVYYDLKTSNSFRNLKRGFAGSRQDQWPIGTTVSGTVCAEPHNAIKDALINTEINLGTVNNPDPLSLNGLLKALETRFYAPRPVFRASPRFGSAPFVVTFQNFSELPALRYFWDFGDGSVSQSVAPTHTYQNSGNYTVTLSVITTLGAQGVATKSEYIQISDKYKPSFFYSTPTSGSTSTSFNFVDQSDGNITSRYWMFGDGNTSVVTDPNNHTASHTYSTTGSYSPSLLLVFGDGSKKIVNATESIVVS